MMTLRSAGLASQTRLGAGALVACPKGGVKVVDRIVYQRHQSVRAAATAAEKDAAAVGEKALQKLLDNNKEWAEKVAKEQPEFFDKLAQGQAPDYLWIGCADSRVPEALVTGVQPGEMFVHRNVGNIVAHSDSNCMSCIEFSVLQLGVKHIVVCGHYKCGAATAALTLPQEVQMTTNHWITHIRAVIEEYQDELDKFEDMDEKISRLCELNAVKQAYKVTQTPTVRTAWAEDKGVTVSAVLFDLASGKLKTLAGPMTSVEDAENFKGYYWEDKIAKDAAAAAAKEVVEEAVGAVDQVVEEVISKAEEAGKKKKRGLLKRLFGSE